MRAAWAPHSQECSTSYFSKPDSIKKKIRKRNHGIKQMMSEAARWYLQIALLNTLAKHQKKWINYSGIVDPAHSA